MLFIIALVLIASCEKESADNCVICTSTLYENGSILSTSKSVVCDDAIILGYTRYDSLGNVVEIVICDGKDN